MYNYFFIHTVSPLVNKLSNDLCVDYKTSTQNPCEEEWPPDQPSSIVNLALIHYKNSRTQQELIECFKRHKGGASAIDQLTLSHSNVTKDIKNIFIPESSEDIPPKRILVEGAPGIGKTVLIKEIAYQWANGKLLKEHKLVFLVYLRDSRLLTIKSVNEMLQLFMSKDTISDVLRYVAESYGANVAFLFDGFDECPIELQKNSFITNLITGKRDGGMFRNSTIVVTSRPTATLFLHHLVDRRIEILGFPKEEREKYISFSLRNSLDKQKELEEYLKQHPIIDSLCYVPLHLAILMYLFWQDSLPDTLTEMNKSFILNTIYRYLEKNQLSSCGLINRLEDLPAHIVKFVCTLSQLAFKGLQNNQLVFTYGEINELYPEIDEIPGAINGFGLLQTIQHYPKGGGAGRTASLNFLHFTTQEYLAALHVSTLSKEKQSLLMEETFWDARYSFMWMMYVGIVGIESDIFIDFIAADKHHNVLGIPYIQINNEIQRDKIKCLHLFQCYVEAKSNAKMPKVISSVFGDGNIVLTGITLLPHHISSLFFFICSSSMQQWNTLILKECNLRDFGMNSLLYYVIDNSKNISTLEYVDLSGNDSSPWAIYCTIIKNCSTNNLTLCGDEGIKLFVKDITHSLQTNVTLKSLTLQRVTQSYKTPTFTPRKPQNTGKLFFSTMEGNDKSKTSNGNSRVVDINVFYDNEFGYLNSPETICLSNKSINDDAICLIMFGLYNNTTVKKLDFSCNNITDDGAIAISDSLEFNNTLKELNLSHNQISFSGMKSLLKCFNHTLTLEYVDLSGNKSSPWSLYCVIIRCCSVKSLTLCGDEGIKQHAKEIKDSLQTNKILQSLTLYKTGKTILQLNVNALIKNEAIKEFLPQSIVINGNLFLSDKEKVDINVLYDSDNKCTSRSISVSNTGINDDTVCLITFGLYNNRSIQKINLSCNNITDIGAIAISDSLQYNDILKELNLSQNQISSIGMNNLSKCFNHSVTLRYVDLSGNKSSPWAVYCAIIRHYCANDLTLCGNEGIKEYVKDIMMSLQMNTKLKSLTLCVCKRTEWLHEYDVVKHLMHQLRKQQRRIGITIISGRLVFSPVDNERIIDIDILYDCDHKGYPKSIKMSNESIDDDTVCFLAFGLYNNTAVQKLDLSCNAITDVGMIAIINCLKYNSVLKELNLSRNHINNMHKVAKHIQHTVPLKYVNLSGNKSSPWSIYCAIIRHCSVHSLTLYGDEGINHYVNDISGSLQINTTLQSLTLCKIGKIGLEIIKTVLVSNTTLVELNLSWKDKGPVIISRKLPINDIRMGSGSSNRVVNVNILYNGNCGNSPKVINFSNKNIDFNAVYLIAFGLHNNTTVQKLDLSLNQLTNDEMITIANTFKYNNTLKEVNLSQNQIGIAGMNALSSCVKCAGTISLEYIDLSKNNSSPWSVYCDIIRHCFGNRLTLCGDKGIKEHIKEIKDSLQSNMMLKSLTLCKVGITRQPSNSVVFVNNKMIQSNAVTHVSNGKLCGLLDYNKVKTILGSQPITVQKAVINGRLQFCTNREEALNITRVVEINILYSNCSPKSINLSKSGLDDDAVCFIAFGLYNNTTVEKLDLSHNNITDNGAIAISDSLECNNSLKELNLSQNEIKFGGMIKLSEAVQQITSLKYVDLSGNNVSPWGVYCAIIRQCYVSSLTLCGDEGIKEHVEEIKDSLQVNNKLQTLTFYKIGSSILQVIDYVLKNTILKKLNMSWESGGAIILHRQLEHTKLGIPNSSDAKRVVDINILYDGYCECSLKTVNFSNKNITDNAVCIIAFGLYNNNMTIQKLDFSYNNITDVGVVAIGDSFRTNSSLKVLLFSGNNISYKGAKVISEFILINKSLQILDISCNSISDNGAMAISDCLKNDYTLQELYLSSNQITTVGAEKIGEAIQVNNTLQKLSVSHNPLCDGVITICDGLKCNNTLLELDLSQSQITNENAKVIAEVIHVNTALQKLDISHNRISDEGVIVISDCLKYNHTLQELNLSWNKLTSKGTEKIAEAVTASVSLKKLDVSSNDVTHQEFK